MSELPLGAGSNPLQTPSHVGKCLSWQIGAGAKDILGVVSAIHTHRLVKKGLFPCFLNEGEEWFVNKRDGI